MKTESFRYFFAITRWPTLLNHIAIIAALALSFGCTIAIREPIIQWEQPSLAQEKEYLPYLAGGHESISGQAFVSLKGGDVVYAAGNEVSLCPATSIGTEWWTKAAHHMWYKNGQFHTATHPSAKFAETLCTTIADGSGNFSFENLAPGKYYIKTTVSWSAGFLVLGEIVEVNAGKTNRILLIHSLPQQ